MNAAQPGDLLAGRYRLRSVAGRGGMGVVWLADDEMLRRPVAIKETIRPAGLDEADWYDLRQRSLREARTAARLNHPEIVSVYDVFEHEGQPWLVMQYVPYPSLREVVRSSGPLPPIRAADVGLKILGAIEAAHAAGVLHRDVKPANVLLGPQGQVVLTDFGLAVADTSPHVTMTGMVMGSPAYMAPERARGEPATPAADLWALGATLYAAVEGRDPFRRASTIAVLTAVAAAAPDAPARAGMLWPVISGLLRKDPEQRLSAPEAGEMLHEVAEAGPASATMPVAVAQLLAADDGTRALSPDAVAALAAEDARADRDPAHQGRSDRGRAYHRGRRPLAGILAGFLAVVALGLGLYLGIGQLTGSAPPTTGRPAGPAGSSSHSPSVVSSQAPSPPSQREHEHHGKHHHGNNGHGAGGNGNGNGNNGGGNGNGGNGNGGGGSGNGNSGGDGDSNVSADSQ
jgi:eukaryotic-like serine/threonine-protein kinase